MDQHPQKINVRHTKYDDAKYVDTLRTADRSRCSASLDCVRHVQWTLAQKRNIAFTAVCTFICACCMMINVNDTDM